MGCFKEGCIMSGTVYHTDTQNEINPARTHQDHSGQEIRVYI